MSSYLGKTTITVYRTTGKGQVVKGVRSVVPDEQFTVSRCNVQDINGKENSFIQDMIDDREAYQIFTRVQLFPWDPNESTKGDRVMVYGSLFDVVFVENWNRRSNSAAHYRVIAVKSQDQQDFVLTTQTAWSSGFSSGFGLSPSDQTPTTPPGSAFDSGFSEGFGD